MSYLGVPPFGQTLRSVEEHTATEGQTVFSVNGGYYPTFIDVVLNGVELYSGDFTATNGTEVVLATGASAGDELKTTVYWPVSLIDSYRKSEVDALLSNVDALPSQTGNGGKYLTTDGTDPSWATLNTDGNTTTKGLYEMANTISADYTVGSGNNAMSAGPITINSGVSVTIPSGSRWAIV